MPRILTQSRWPMNSLCERLNIHILNTCATNLNPFCGGPSRLWSQHHQHANVSFLMSILELTHLSALEAMATLWLLCNVQQEGFVRHFVIWDSAAEQDRCDSVLGFCCSYWSDIVTLLLFAVLPLGTLPPSRTGVIVCDRMIILDACRIAWVEVCCFRSILPTGIRSWPAVAPCGGLWILWGQNIPVSDCFTLVRWGMEAVLKHHCFFP